MMMRLVTLAVSLGLFTAAAAETVDLRPHRALYDLDLAAARQGSDVTGLRGRMALEWADACDGWTVSQNIRMNVRNRDGASIANDIGFSSFETKAGDGFRFNSRWIARGEPFQEYVGHAETGAAGGRAIFTVPDGETVELPAGTLFPTEHMFMLVDAAAAGERLLSRIVFTGSEPDSLHEVTAFIGLEIPRDSRALGPAGNGKSVFRDLAALRSWPVSMGYFPAGSADAEPEFEIAFRLLENGVASDLVLDYNEFAMRAALVEIEFLPPPEC